MIQTNQAICFTGHRTLKKKYYDSVKPSFEWGCVWTALMAYIKRGYAAGYTDWLVGGALGVDMIAGLCLAELIKTGQAPGLNGYLCIPHPNYNNRWRYDTTDRSNLNILYHYLNPLVLDTGPNFSRNLLFARNHFMVLNSVITCAVFDGRDKGGTRECLNFATNHNKRTCVINPYEIDGETGRLREEWTKPGMEAGK